MSNEVFQQNLNDEKGSRPGGPYLIQMLFKEPVSMPGKAEMTAVMEKHIGTAECFCHDKKTAGFAAPGAYGGIQGCQGSGTAHGDGMQQI